MTTFFITVGVLTGQALFSRAFGGISADYPSSITQTTDGGCALAGFTGSFGAGNWDLLVLKLGPSGNLDWARTIGDTVEDRGSSIVQTADGGYAVAGYTSSFGAGYSDLFVLKLGSSGNLDWAKTIGWGNDDGASSMIQTTDGGFAIAGYTYSFGIGDPDPLVLKMGPSGTLDWALTFGGTGIDAATSITRTTDGGYVVAGYTYSFGAGSADFLVTKLDSLGGLSWTRTIGGAGEDRILCITPTTDGGCAVAGLTYSFGAGGVDCLVLKLSPSGTLDWTRTIGGANNDLAWSLTQTTDGGYAVAGWSQSFGAGMADPFVFKLSPSGTLDWARTFGGTGGDYGSLIAQTTDGCYAVAGWTYSFGAGDWDMLVFKLGADGNYSGCIQSCSPTVTTPVLSTASQTVGTSCSLIISSQSPVVNTPSLSVTDLCAPLYVGEVEHTDLPGPGITCAPLPGGALFNSPEALPIRIYSGDGRLTYSGNLGKGENRISLETGVYLWKAGTYRGKVIAR